MGRAERRSSTETCLIKLKSAVSLILAQPYKFNVYDHGHQLLGLHQLLKLGLMKTFSDTLLTFHADKFLEFDNFCKPQ